MQTCQYINVIQYDVAVIRIRNSSMVNDGTRDVFESTVVVLFFNLSQSYFDANGVATNAHN